jgi:hypothetical protein
MTEERAVDFVGCSARLAQQLALRGVVRGLKPRSSS